MNQQFFVYVIADSSTGRLYIGQTNNLEERIKRHNQGRSKYTKYGSWKLLFYETYPTRSQAMKRERYLKSMKSKQRILELIKKRKSC